MYAYTEEHLRHRGVAARQDSSTHNSPSLSHHICMCACMYYYACSNYAAVSTRIL